MRSTTPRITPIPTLVLALALGAASLVGARAEAQRSSTVDLRELELARDGRRNGQLALHFALARGARPDVQLHVSVDGARRDRELVATLDARAGWIPLGRSGRVTSVMIRATDRRGRVLPMELGRGLVVTAVELTSDVVVDRADVDRRWGGQQPASITRADDGHAANEDVIDCTPELFRVISAAAAKLKGGGDSHGGGDKKRKHKKKKHKHKKHKRSKRDDER